jgi:gliding motility-associated lipoprotein GldH
MCQNPEIPETEEGNHQKEIRVMRNNLVLYLMLLTLTACIERPDYIQYFPITDHLWYSDHSVEFVVDNKDTISRKNVFINIRNNKNYEFSSLFLISKIEFPDGIHVVDTLEYEMTDPSGKWLGSGFTDIKENKLFYKENVIFDQSGNYRFIIKQATRSIDDIEGKNPLKGITDVGISIEKVE